MQKKLYAIFELWAALTMTDVFPLQYIISHGNEAMASTLSTILLYGSVLMGSIIIISGKKKIHPAIIISAIIFILGRYENSVTNGTSAELVSRFVIHGIGGCIIGLGITDYRRFIKIIAFVSFFYGIFLVLEPITHTLMPNSNAMATGYIMSPLVIWILIGRHLNITPKWTLLVGIPMAITTIIFTSRGCGLSILAALLVYYYFRKGSKTGLFRMVFGVVILYIGVQLFLQFFSMFSPERSYGEGSLLEKTTHGYAEDYNGREELWIEGYSLLGNNWLTGTGMGMDRLSQGYGFVHNIILEILINFGIPLGLLLLFMYWVTYYKCFTVVKAKQIKYLLLSLICMYWIKLLFSDSYLSNMHGLIFMLGLSISLRLEIKNKMHTRFLTGVK